ncbi:unnamed protein product, partial [Allacma fusca]
MKSFEIICIFVLLCTSSLARPSSNITLGGKAMTSGANDAVTAMVGTMAFDEGPIGKFLEIFRTAVSLVTGSEAGRSNGLVEENSRRNVDWSSEIDTDETKPAKHNPVKNIIQDDIDNNILHARSIAREDAISDTAIAEHGSEVGKVSDPGNKVESSDSLEPRSVAGSTLGTAKDATTKDITAGQTRSVRGGASDPGNEVAGENTSAKKSHLVNEGATSPRNSVESGGISNRNRRAIIAETLLPLNAATLLESHSREPRSLIKLASLPLHSAMPLNLQTGQPRSFSDKASLPLNSDLALNSQTGEPRSLSGGASSQLNSDLGLNSQTGEPRSLSGGA